MRPVRRGEGARLRAIRLASLRADPAAFGATPEREEARPAAFWHERAALSESGAEQRTFVLVDADDRWLGLALARAAEAPAERRAVVNAMWVAPEARGRGAGRVLADACAAWAAERGFRSLELAVIAGNEAALRAYRAAGFAETGAGRTLADGRRELTMVRQLEPPD